MADPILRVETVPPDVEVVLWDKPPEGVYVVAVYRSGKPYSAGHHQRLDEAEREFALRTGKTGGQHGDPVL
jgi:hypothetical protein